MLGFTPREVFETPEDIYSICLLTDEDISTDLYMAPYPTDINQKPISGLNEADAEVPKTAVSQMATRDWLQKQVNHCIMPQQHFDPNS